ncbi:MAG: neutral/alkaline non-lysosomal ceramidase N-terminal domain-containing protein [Opitutaceae bacterium]|nr:neutral/alkaline non-lysosomal ceramidase N-terminal domain-containing protein [Opitutaceae bacterium]
MTLHIGWAQRDITPQKPVELIGQYYQRLSRGVRDPLSVTALAVEQRGSAEQVVMVAVDTLFVTRDFQDEVRTAIRGRIPGLNPDMVVLNATHTHSAPSWFAPFRWWKPAKDALQPAEIRALILEGVVAAVEEAWQSRRVGGVSDASAYATTGFCRRLMYDDGSAEMYGDPARPDFLGVEAGSDDEVRLLFTWDEQKRLTGVVFNVACPAQVMEATYVVSADFFGELRELVRRKFGKAVNVLGQVSAAGDLSPRNLPGQAREEVNYWNESGVNAIAQRLFRAIEEGYAAAVAKIDLSPVVRHRTQEITLPIRRATREEYEAARSEIDTLCRPFPDEDTASRELYGRFVRDMLAREQKAPHGPFDNKNIEFVYLENAQAVVARYESQDRVALFSMELHVIRLGDCAFVLNPFELYLDFGQKLQARSPAKRTFIVELACDAAGYLPTARAAKAGGYGSLIINGKVGPDGGALLVEASLQAIQSLWCD